MEQKLEIQEIKTLLTTKIELPSPPAIAVRILNTVQQEEFSMDDLEKIISADVALTTKLLRVANSAYYALPSKVSNVNRALAVLGTNIIKNIALSFVIAGDLKNSGGSYFEFDHFWRRSVTTAVAADLLTRAINSHNDDIFVTGLLQDIGIMVIFLYQGATYDKILKSRTSYNDANLIAMEKENFKFDHQQLSHILLSDWGLPEKITEVLLYHHEPEKAPKHLQETASILELASLLSSIYSGGETATNVCLLNRKMKDYFAIEPEQTQEIIDQVALQSISILEIFEVNADDIKPYSTILQEANEELGKLNLSYEQLVLELKESKARSECFAKKLQQANLKLEELAFRDGLTGLYNHRYFQEVLARELARARRYKRSLGLLIFDIDYFKKINDTYGHPVGDKVLVQMAQSIEKAIRPSDILARYGGEEFVMILPETNFTGLKVFAERLRRCVEQMEVTEGQDPIRVTISGGGVHLPPEADVPQSELVDLADKKLYISKREGRNRVTVASCQ